jgi:hypothetical protein
MNRVLSLCFLCVFLALPGTDLFCGGPEGDLFVLSRLSYDYVKTGDQEIHSPGLAFGITKGVADVPFNEVHKQFQVMALYQPFFFRNDLLYVAPQTYHRAKLMLDARWERHQLLGLFSSETDKPLAGGLSTVKAGLGWGYELLRYSNLSLILGVLVGVADFGIDLPSGDPLPILPVPLIRFSYKAEWLTASLEYLDSPSLNFTIAPGKPVRFTGNMTIVEYRGIEDLLGEGVLWYRFFASGSHSLGDFAGIGLGFKNETMYFNVASERGKTFEQQYTSIFGMIDISIVQLMVGYIMDSRTFYDRTEKRNSGKGYFISVLGQYRF